MSCNLIRQAKVLFFWVLKQRGHKKVSKLCKRKILIKQITQIKQKEREKTEKNEKKSKCLFMSKLRPVLKNRELYKLFRSLDKVGKKLSIEELPQYKKTKHLFRLAIYSRNYLHESLIIIK